MDLLRHLLLCIKSRCSSFEPSSHFLSPIHFHRPHFLTSQPGSPSCPWVHLSAPRDHASLHQTNPRGPGFHDPPYSSLSGPGSLCSPRRAPQSPAWRAAPASRPGSAARPVGVMRDGATTARPDPGGCLPHVRSCKSEPRTSVRQTRLPTPGMARCARLLVPPGAQARVLSRATSFSIHEPVPSSPSVSFNRPLLVLCMLVLSRTRMSSLNTEVKEPNS